ncbi:MAG: hypothetical protein KatS3mg108_3706 [Isosphaeraceae bacterium]|jgi:uncharacterized protein YecE (DUF72 family)|nr:MAG: hypothetical protein KatS3mg108_3706 [Isosphaeraceae bacterium]
MTQLDLFDAAEPPLMPQAARLAPRLRALAERGVYFGTSSWKYPGWLGTIYTPERYQTRGKFNQKLFDATCLEEYARVFPLVGGDFSFYQFPSREYWARLFGQTPETLLFALKVPEEITVPVWPRHARYGERAGKANEHFLDVGLYRRLFADLLKPHAHRVAVLIFEFGTYAKRTFATPDAFLDELAPFLAGLPDGFRHAVEVRNPELLRERRYFDTLAASEVAHVFNAWTRMPALSDQVAIPEADTADFLVARALLRKGRSYEQAVELFEPYERIQEPDPAGRQALADLAKRALERKKPAFLLVNNRYEGNAPSTIEAIVDAFEL